MDQATANNDIVFPNVISVTDDVAVVIDFVDPIKGQLLDHPMRIQKRVTVVKVLSKRRAKGVWDGEAPYRYEVLCEI